MNSSPGSEVPGSSPPIMLAREEEVDVEVRESNRRGIHTVKSAMICCFSVSAAQ